MEGPDSIRRMAEGSRNDGTGKEKAGAEEGEGQPERCPQRRRSREADFILIERRNFLIHVSHSLFHKTLVLYQVNKCYKVKGSHGQLIL